MFKARKLKPDRSLGGLIAILAVVAVFGLSALLFGYVAGFYIAGILLWVYALFYFFVFIRTGNIAHLVPTTYIVFLGLMLILAPFFGETIGTDIGYRIAWFSGILFFGILLVYVAYTKKIKWRGREIFELAAESVEDPGNGYTPRPRPVGKVEFTKQEILSFARFITSNLIAISYVNPKQITFVPVKMGDEFLHFFKLGGPDYDTTWINIDFDGDISVHISQKDYLDYREPLAFDKLCESLGQLFVDFLELHHRGEGIRIIDRLDAVGLSFFS